jgi:hypothetical protein
MTKPSLILDLDQTLIVCKTFSRDFIYDIENSGELSKNYYLDINPELRNVIPSNNIINHDDLYLTQFNLMGCNDLHIIFKRPYLDEFITTVNKYFDIYIYSAGGTTYVNNVIDALEKYLGCKPFIKVISNNPDSITFYKKLSKLNIGYSNVLIIDDNNYPWSFDRHNLIKIYPYDASFVSQSFDLFSNDPFECSASKFIKYPSKDKTLFEFKLHIEEYFKQHPDGYFNMYDFKNIIIKTNSLKRR